MNKGELRARVAPLLHPVYKGLMRLSGLPPHLPFDYEGQAAGDAIRALLEGAEPCMICRFGSLEISVVAAYLNRREKGFSPRRLLRGAFGECMDWDAELRDRIGRIAGFFPVNDETLSRFSELTLSDAASIDLLGSWRPEEARIRDRFPSAKAIPLGDLEPYYHERPWSKALEGRKVLVVHPFVKTIEKQYAKRRRLFSNPDVLPDFELKTIPAVQSLAGNEVGFATWFDALESMCGKMDACDYDVALIGAGAYGLSLAAHAKRRGRKAVHMGGASQLLFGIRGWRWDRMPFYQKLANEDWTRPSQDETPKSHKSVEGGSYW